MAKFTVYSTPGCPQCTATARDLEKHDMPYDYIDITVDPEAEAHAKSLGHVRAPVVVAPNGEHWSGFRPDFIEKHARALVSA